MSDAQTGEINPAEAPAPSVPAEESQVQEVDQPQAQPQESPEAETGQTKVEENAPKDNAAWAAMRTENKRLKDAVASVDPEYLERLRGATAPQTPQYQPTTPLSEDADYTQVTHEVNRANQQTYYAQQQVAKLQQQLELQQDRQAEEAFPELKSDKVFQQIVAEKKLAARVLGNDRTTLEIAREVKGLLGKREQQIAVQTEEAVKQQEAERKVAMAEARGTTTQGNSAVQDDELRMRVRRGDSDAQLEQARRILGDLEIT